MNHPLHEFIGYRLIHLLKAHRALIEPAFSEIGLYPGQEMILFLLWEREGLTQSDLGSCLCVD
ncbi:MAG: MarR family transcriptional regulator, partial [Anaerolineae bacterium]|nr:MarR family transcriptional regulator [Anaerolineae bacterium]